MIAKTKGIVLNTIKYSESSIICKIFTKEYGLLSFMINGVRSSKSKEKAGLFQPLNMLEIVFLLHDNKQLLHLKEYRSALNYQNLPFQFERSSFGLFVLEMLNKTIRSEREPASEKYEFIEEALLYLDQSEKVSANFHLAFMIKYATYVGFEPDIDEGSLYFDLQSGHSINENPLHPFFLRGQEKKVFQQLKILPLQDIRQVPLNKEMRVMLFKHIEYYYTYHLENFTTMKSPDVLAELYS
jgi:DNA repair protein RecO (recombination protein O)